MKAAKKPGKREGPQRRRPGKLPTRKPDATCLAEAERMERGYANTGNPAYLDAARALDGRRANKGPKPKPGDDALLVEIMRAVLFRGERVTTAAKRATKGDVTRLRRRLRTDEHALNRATALAGQAEAAERIDMATREAAAAIALDARRLANFLGAIALVATPAQRAEIAADLATIMRKWQAGTRQELGAHGQDLA